MYAPIITIICAANTNMLSTMLVFADRNQRALCCAYCITITQIYSCQTVKQVCENMNGRDHGLFIYFHIHIRTQLTKLIISIESHYLHCSKFKQYKGMQRLIEIETVCVRIHMQC